MHVIWFDRPLPEAYAHFLGGRVRQVYSAPDQQGDRFRSLVDADAIILGSSTRLTAEIISRAPRLRAICRTGIGTDNIDISAATCRGVAVCNAPDGPTISTAEHTMALLFAVAKCIPMAQYKLRQGTERDPFSSHDGLELMGLQLGLIGLGRIGGRVASLAAGLGMRVMAYDPNVSTDEFAVLAVERIENLDMLLGRADIVSLHIPLTPQTRHLINIERLARMKPHAILINASRGGLVDETALQQALKSGHLRGAGLDVFEVEPVQPEHPLLQFDTVVATPHVAAATCASKARLWSSAIGQAIDTLEGRRPKNLVNPEVWQPPVSTL